MKMATETKRGAEQIDWRPTRDVLKGYEEYSKQCLLSGMDSYLDGECTTAIIGEAIFHSYENAVEAYEAVANLLRGEVKTEAEIEAIVRNHFFLFGVYKAFLCRSSKSLDPIRKAKEVTTND